MHQNTTDLLLGTNGVHVICAEMIEDAHYPNHESDYDDDTHDWGGDSQDISHEYWHFVGSMD